MSKLYTLTAEIHQLIETINKQKGKELRVESDYCFFTSYGNDHKIIEFGHQGYENLYESEFGADDMRVLESALNPENIQKLLCDLDLGENSEYTKLCNQLFSSLNPYNPETYELISWASESEPQTQAKALSDKWFSLQETDGKPTISLWNSGGVGQIQVLTELKEVLENYLNNNNYDQKN